MKCPTCEGRPRQGIGLACGPRIGCQPIMTTCRDCGGTGEVSGERAEWMRVGRAMADERQARDLSLREEARRRGMKPSVLSDMEFGRIKPERADAAKEGR